MAQENAYLLSLGNICGIGVGTNPCAPMGNANPNIYAEGNIPEAPHVPFYDIVTGCNDNDITQSPLAPSEVLIVQAPDTTT